MRTFYHLNVEGRKRTVFYTPPEGFPRSGWIQQKYSHGGFTRSFALNNAIEVAAISARYKNGVLHVSLSFSAKANAATRSIAIG